MANGEGRKLQPFSGRMIIVEEIWVYNFLCMIKGKSLESLLSLLKVDVMLSKMMLAKSYFLVKMCQPTFDLGFLFLLTKFFPLSII